LNYAAGKERQKAPEGWLRIELRGGQGATKSPEDGCALNYAAGKERQKVPEGRLRIELRGGQGAAKSPEGAKGGRFIRSADIF
jgi:hypothetical protein